MSSPLIGITTSRQLHQQGYPLISIPEAYIQAVVQAGGIPVLIPLGIPDRQLQDMLAHLDGILFSGGGDIDPGRYGADPHPEVSFVDSDRDRVEIQLVLDAVHRGTPFLGICRGIQTVNVALGGTLFTHLPDQRPSGVHHPYIEGNSRGYLAHSVQVQPGTHLHRILGQSSVQVNSMHHQGIEHLAPGLLDTAHAPDGLVEAIELSDHRFGIAVQWHPEWLTGQATMRALFRAFVEAAEL
jgi:putative glutamine amidotransferase